MGDLFPLFFWCAKLNTLLAPLIFGHPESCEQKIWIFHTHTIWIFHTQKNLDIPHTKNMDIPHTKNLDIPHTKDLDTSPNIPTLKLNRRFSLL